MSAGYNETATERFPIVDVLASAAVNTVQSSSPGVDLSKFRRAFWVLEVTGVASGVLNCVVQSAAASNFATPHNYATTVLNNLNTNARWETFEIRADQVIQANPGDRYARLNVTPSGTAT